jgi:hypothetical protein
MPALTVIFIFAEPLEPIRLLEMIEPLVDGLNISGPRSPTIYGNPAATGPPFALKPKSKGLGLGAGVGAGAGFGFGFDAGFAAGVGVVAPCVALAIAAAIIDAELFNSVIKAFTKLCAALTPAE